MKNSGNIIFSFFSGLHVYGKRRSVSWIFIGIWIHSTKWINYKINLCKLKTLFVQNNQIYLSRWKKEAPHVNLHGKSVCIHSTNAKWALTTTLVSPPKIWSHCVNTEPRREVSGLNCASLCFFSFLVYLTYFHRCTM